MSKDILGSIRDDRRRLPPYDVWIQIRDILSGGNQSLAVDVWLDHFVGRFVDDATDSRGLHASNILWEVARHAVQNQNYRKWFDRPEFDEIQTPLREIAKLVAGKAFATQAEALFDAGCDLIRAAGDLVRDDTATLGHHLSAAVRGYLAFLGVHVSERNFERLRYTEIAGMQGTVDQKHFWIPWVQRSVTASLADIEEQWQSVVPKPPLAIALAMAEHGLLWILGAEPELEAARWTTIVFAAQLPKMVGNRETLLPVKGAFAHLEVRRWKPGRTIFYPDPVQLGITCFSADWLGSFQRAANVARRACDGEIGACAWSLHFPGIKHRVPKRDTEPQLLQRPPVLVGESASAAAEAALEAIGKNQHLDPGTCITGVVRENGEVGPVTGTVAKILGLPAGDGKDREDSDEAGTDSRRSEEFLDNLQPYIQRFLAPNPTDWLKQAAEKRGIQVHHVDHVSQGFDWMSTRLVQVLEFLDKLGRNGLSDNVLYLPPNLSTGEIADFCLPVRVIDEQDWQRLERDRIEGGRFREPVEREYLFAQSEEFWRMDGERRATPRSLEQVLAANRWVVLRGEPGEGKTTSLYLHVAQRCRTLREALLNGECGLDSAKCRIPLPLPLSKAAPTESGRRFSVIRRAQIEALRIAYGSAKQAPEAVKEWLQEKAARGEIDLCLDALDELDIRWHESLRGELDRDDPQRRSEVGVFLTTRLSADDSKVIRNARRYRMVCFGPAQVREYTTRYFSNVENGEQFAHVLRDQLRLSPGPRHLAQIPLLLALLCEWLASRREKPIEWLRDYMPKRRTKLLEFALHRLLERGDKKLVERDDFRRGNPVADSPSQRNRIKEAVLRHVAWRFFATRPLPIDKETLIGVLDEQLDYREQAWKRYTSPPNGEALLDEFLQDGVLVRQDEGVYRFVLRSLHEFLGARYIAEQPKSLALVEQFLWQVDESGRLNWKPEAEQIIVLLAGCLSLEDAESLVQRLVQLDNQQRDLGRTMLLLAGKCVSEIDGTQSGEPTASRFIESIADPILRLWRHPPRGLGSDDVLPALASYGSRNQLLAFWESKVVRSWETGQAAIASARLGDDRILEDLLSELNLDTPTWIMFGIDHRAHLDADILPTTRLDGYECAIFLALGLLGSPRVSEKLLDLLVRCRTLEDGYFDGPASALAMAGDESAVEPVVRALGSESWIVRANAATALGKMRHPLAEGPLIEALKDSRPEVQHAAIAALGCVGGPSAFEALRGVLLQNPETDAKIAAAWSLGELGDARIIDDLINYSHHESVDLAAVAVAALGRFSDTRARNYLLEIIRTLGSFPVWNEAAAALASVGDLSAEDIFVEYMERDYGMFSFSAVSCLGDMRSARCTQALREMLRHHREAAYRKNAATVLGMVAAEEGIDDLYAGLSDVDDRVRTAAARSLLRIARRTGRWIDATRAAD